MDILQIDAFASHGSSGSPVFDGHGHVIGVVYGGAKVGLMDTDVYGPNIPTMMGVTEQPKIMNHPTRGEFFVPPIP